MKSLLEFKQSAVNLEKPNKEWEKLYQNLLDKFKEWGLDNKVESFVSYQWNDISSNFNKYFERVFIGELIRHVLDIKRGDTLFYNIFSIRTVNSFTKSYHGSDSNVYIETYDFLLKSKQEILDNLTGEWVFNHYDQVKDFMDQYNDKYIKLVEIKRLFPISIEK